MGLRLAIRSSAQREERAAPAGLPLCWALPGSCCFIPGLYEASTAVARHAATRIPCFGF